MLYPGTGGPGALLSLHRLMDKPIGYGPIVRGSNPRGEAMKIIRGDNMIIKPKIICWKTLEAIEDGYYATEKHYQPLEHKWHDATIHHDYKEAPFDDLHKDVLIQELVKNKYIICGDTHQNLCIPVFNDGYLLLSMRKWSELMDDAFMYMDPLHHREHWFYMVNTCDIKENLPCRNQ